MPHNFSWLIEGQLAGMGRPGCGLELSREMLPLEQRFLSWLHFSPNLRSGRFKLAKRIGLPTSNSAVIDRRMFDLYRKFRDIWGILSNYREGFGEGGELIDTFEVATDRLTADLQFLEAQSVNTIVSLTETPLAPEILSEYSFNVLHLPIPDQKAPSHQQIDNFVEFLDNQLSTGNRVMAHCLGGYGRTGTMLCSFLVHCGLDAEAALREVRRVRPGSVQSEEQEQAILDYEERAG